METEGMAIPYLQCVAAFRVALESFEMYLTLRQRRNYLAKEIRPEMKDIVPEEKFLKAQAYGKDKADFGIIESLFNTALNLVFYFTYFMPFVWKISLQLMQAVKPSLGPENEIIRTLVFCALNYVVGIVTSTPFSLYYNFVIQERYDFNRLTGLQFVKDIALGGLVAGLIGIPAIIAIWYIIELGGEYLWLAFWLFFVVLTLFLQLIHPTIIAPLFNKFTPLEEGKLRSEINTLAASLNFPLKMIFVIDGSKRSSHSNAYFFGLFSKRIVLYDTLLEQNSGHDERILGVLCHELGHWYLGHIKKNMAIALSHMLLVSWIFGKTVHNTHLFKSFGFSDTPHIIGLLLFSEIYTPVEAVLSFGMNWLSRKFEYEADDFAKGMNYKDHLAEALVNLHIENLSNMNPDPLYSAYHNSHPTVLERIEALDARPTNVFVKDEQESESKKEN